MLKGKRIMIFGGGINQLTLIETAKCLGVSTLVIDPNDKAPGKEIADFFEVVDSQDYETTKSLALKYKVDGIITSQMENPLMLMARLSEELGYIFPSYEVIKRCRNKFLMKQALISKNIQCARGVLFKNSEKIDSKRLEGLCFPLIIKPIDAHSSRGVFRVNNIEELLQFEIQTRSYSSDGSILIEEFIDGKEYSVESLTYKGKTSIIQITEKIITPYPYTVEIGHIQPANLREEEKYEIEKVVIRAIKALGIDNSASHTELKLTRQGAFIIEVGARPGGDFIS